VYLFHKTMSTQKWLATPMSTVATQVTIAIGVWISNCYRPNPERRLWFKYMYLCSKCYRKLNTTDRIPGHGSQTIQNMCVCCYRQYPWRWFRNDSNMFACIPDCYRQYPRWWLSKFLHGYASLIKCLWGLSHTRQSTWLCLRLHWLTWRPTGGLLDVSGGTARTIEIWSFKTYN